MSNTERGRPVDIHTPMEGRVRTLEHVGRIVCSMGLASKPLEPWKVHQIEQRALNKIRKALHQ